ncbi:MAG: glycosyl transferase [Chloroflexi bacterium]|nr:glycosyl transferase [Chloroflexota bacterium]
MTSLRNYCTYFDQRYLLMGLALHQSLMQHAGDFKLWILALDDETYRILDRMRLPRVALIRLSEFENPALLAVKNTRSAVEYYWTATPDLPLYIFSQDASVSHITYLDADLFFFAPPEPVESALGNGSILIVEHRYSPEWAFMAQESGIYNVSLITFRRDANALACLHWWRERCLEWCYVRPEKGKKGDQKYLDDWLTRFPGVVVLNHVGCGVAPWNISNYQIHLRDGSVWIDDVPLLFYHFHQFRQLGPRQFDLAQSYRLSRQHIDLIYRPYVAVIQENVRRVNQVSPNFQGGYFKRDWFREIKRILKRRQYIQSF